MFKIYIHNSSLNAALQIKITKKVQTRFVFFLGFIDLQIFI